MLKELPLAAGTPAGAGPRRRVSRRVVVGDVAVGGGAPVSVQSMTTAPTHQVDATLQQIAALQNAGCDIVRVACPRQEDADALAMIAAKSRIPVIADIHFQWKYAVKAIEAGCAGVRINPGTIRKHDKVALIGRLAAEAGVAIRVGANGGSLEGWLLAKHGGPTAEALVEAALGEARLLEEVGFSDIKVSVKHSDPWMMIQAYRLLAGRCPYPLHLGVTEAGTPKVGVVKSAVGIGALLAEGIGDTIRVSLAADPVEEVKCGLQILEALQLRPPHGFQLIACPSCGRAEVDVYRLAEAVQAELEGLDVPLRVAVMGCVVNGPGEAREADLGVAAGRGKGQIIRQGQVIATVREQDIVETLVHFAHEMADEIRTNRGRGPATVTS